MPDFRAFLPSSQPVVLPYFGGTRVDSDKRRFRVEQETEPGWWRFAIDGRKATPKEKAEPLDLGSLPIVRGHWVDNYIVSSGRDLARVALPPSEEPAALSKVVGRRWYSGDMLLDSIEFEDDAELSARTALEQRRGIADVRGVVPSLRAAFGYALGLAVAREERVPVTLRELTRVLVAIADGGRDAVVAHLTHLADQRRAREAELRARALLQAVNAERAKVREIANRAVRERRGTPAERADAALEAAGARMLSARRVDAVLEVTFTYMDVRIIATVDPESLHVWDSGVCLAGADEELTLDSLPSVIKEAIENDLLNIVRH